MSGALAVEGNLQEQWGPETITCWLMTATARIVLKYRRYKYFSEISSIYQAYSDQNHDHSESKRHWHHSHLTADRFWAGVVQYLPR
jgi:hypothetical protein